jgi:hypothetical protein
VTAHIGLLTIQLHIPLSHSLKEKRRVVNRIKTRVQNKFNASVAEIDELDKWQLATMAVAMVSNDRRMLEKSLQEIGHFIDNIILGQAQIIRQEIQFF